LQALRDEAKESIRDYTTRRLPLQIRICFTALECILRRLWEISQSAQEDKDKLKALEMYQWTHLRILTLLREGPTAVSMGFEEMLNELPIEEWLAIKQNRQWAAKIK
jgi:hypothetical protein